MISEQLIEEILAQKSAPAHITKPEELNIEKQRQRAEAARYLSNHHTILELYAGEGNLSEKVYAPLNPRRMVLVDDDAQALEKARSRLASFGVKKEFYPMPNEQFIKRGYLRKYPDISLVDFDAYGSPGRTVQLFFDNYRVRQPMIATLTDEFPTDRFKMAPPFGTSGGKRREASFLKTIVPGHELYVEPFAGAASLFFSFEDPPARAILNDKDSDIIKMFDWIKKAGPEDVADLTRRDWRPNPARFKSMQGSKPTDPNDAAYRFLYLRRHSFMSGMQTFRGKTDRPSDYRPPAWLDRIDRYREHLKGVQLTNDDYREIISKYDSPQTFFYIDPPYEKEFSYSLPRILSNIKGHWLLSFSDDPQLSKQLKSAGYQVFRIPVYNQIGKPTGKTRTMRRELMAANYPIEVPEDLVFKALDVDPGFPTPPTPGEICMFHEVMMKNLGARRRFKSWRIGRAFGGKSGRAIYSAYLLRPLS
jgi:DNA adenine methylase